jgi:polyisoprenyl-phosphate glycosyltransferase
MRPDGQPLLSVVVPVYNEERLLPELHRRIADSLDSISGGYEVVYVDDGSTDGSCAAIERLAQENSGVVLVVLSRNFGMEIAMSAGMDHAEGDYVVLMHADLQDPPELVPQMLEEADKGADVVYARRIGRDESAMKKFLALIFFTLMKYLARVPYQGQAGDFRLMSRRVVEALREMPERRRFVRGMVSWVGFKQEPIEYRRSGRAGGRGASYPQLFALALEGMASFSDVPLNLATYLGLFTASLSGIGAAVTLGLTVFNVVTPSTQIWILVAVLFLGGVQLISIGILGRYLARVHEESLKRPLYLVDRVVAAGRRAGAWAQPPTDRRGRGLEVGAVDEVVGQEGNARRDVRGEGSRDRGAARAPPLERPE